MVWFGACGLEVLGDHDDGVEVTIDVQTTATVAACAGCGTRARAKDRRWVTLRDAPLADRAVRVRWRKRIWACPDTDCEVNTWTEAHELAEPRRVLARRGGRWVRPRAAHPAKTLRRWRHETIAHHATGASNGPVEAADLLIKQIKRSGRGFRNLDNYRLRILLTGHQNPTCQTPSVTSIRTRRPRLVA